MDATPRELCRERRIQLAQLMGKNSVAVIPSGRILEHDERHYPFAVDRNFLYLTGHSEPDLCLLIVCNKEGVRSTLFCSPKNSEREMWEGERLDPQYASDILGVDEILLNSPEEDIAKWVGKYVSGPGTVYYPKEPAGDYDERYLAPVKKLERFHLRSKAFRFRDIAPLLGEMRIHKDVHEQAIMRRAARISAYAHRHILSFVRVGMNECEIEAEISAQFRKNGGSPLHAYNAIVAGGKNACVLHYTKNNELLRSGELLLIDAGCEIEGYASDITRVIPVNGKFTPPQRAIYNIVLRAQREAIAHARPGYSFADIEDLAVMEICEGLINLGVIKKNGVLEASFYKKSHKPFFPHGIGHWLGLSVHDKGDYCPKGSEGNTRKMRKFEAGMVITVEPGIYIRPQEGIPQEFWNIGVRIEDDILISNGDPEVLSAAAPKDPDEIEALMRYVPEWRVPYSD